MVVVRADETWYHRALVGPTDAGLLQLGALPDLTLLRTFNSKKVTDAGRVELRKAIPKCKVD